MKDGGRAVPSTGSLLYDRPKTGYKCSRCGLPKRNHVCTYRPDPNLTPDQQRPPASRARRESRGAAENDKLRVSWAKREDDTIRACVQKVCEEVARMMYDAGRR